MRLLCSILLCLAFMPAFAQSFIFPASFRVQEISTNGVTIHVRTGGTGPAVVLLHGYGETGDMWAPMAADLDHGGESFGDCHNRARLPGEEAVKAACSG